MDLSLRDAAKILRVSESTLSRWVGEEGLPAFLINGRYRFNRVDLLEWASHRKLPAAELYEAAAGEETLAALLEGNIHHEVPGADARAAMEAVAERLPLPSARDKALAAQALAARERLGSTGVGDGIAIPHARSPLVFALERPALTLCFLAREVPFGAADGKPVRAVLALVSPTVRCHLSSLAKVASALHDPALRGLIHRQAPAAELLARLQELG